LIFCYNFSKKKGSHMLYKIASEKVKEEIARQTRNQILIGIPTGNLGGMAYGAVKGSEKGHPVVGALWGPAGIQGAVDKNTGKSHFGDAVLGTIKGVTTVAVPLGAISGGIVGGALHGGKGALLGALGGGLYGGATGVLGGAGAGVIGYGAGRLFGEKKKKSK
jgi:hypothetical protein